MFAKELKGSSMCWASCICGTTVKLLLLKDQVDTFQTSELILACRSKLRALNEDIHDKFRQLDEDFR